MYGGQPQQFQQSVSPYPGVMVPPPVYDPVLKMQMPAGLRNRGRIARKITTWDMTGQQLIDAQIRNIEPQHILEIRGGRDSSYIVPVHPIDKIQKATLTTGDAGAYNALFGAVATIQLSQQQTMIGALPKKGYPREGFRAVSAAAIASGAGIAEGAAVGTGVEPTYVEITVGQKEVEVVTEMSTRMEVISAKNDNIEFEGNAQVVFSNFMEALDVDLLVDMDTLAGANHESLDRICGSSGENTALGYTAADEDLYGVDRSVATWFNANSDHASGVDRSLSKSLVDALMRDQKEFWQYNIDQKIYASKNDSWIEFSAIEGARQRMGEETVVANVNGLNTFRGGAGGFKLSTYDGFPWLQDENISADTIGRIMLLDLNHVGLCVGRPIEFLESDNPFEVGHLHRCLWYGIHENWCDLPAAEGKLRDLKTA